MSKQKEGFELCGILTNGHAEWLNGKTGLPEGSSLQNYATKGRISLFSDNALLRDFPEIENRSKMFQYAAIKERVKMLFGIWPDSYKHRG